MKVDLYYHPRNITMGDVEDLLPEIREVMSKHGISFAYLLGSLLIPEAKAQDLDIAVYIGCPTQSILDYYNGVYFDLCDAFKADNIDVVIMNNVDSAFRHEIIKTGRLIYCQSCRQLAEFIEDTLFNYEDLKYFKNEYRRELHKRVKGGLLMTRRQLNKEKIDTH